MINKMTYMLQRFFDYFFDQVYLQIQLFFGLKLYNTFIRDRIDNMTIAMNDPLNDMRYQSGRPVAATIFPYQNNVA